MLQSSLLTLNMTSQMMMMMMALSLATSSTAFTGASSMAFTGGARLRPATPLRMSGADDGAHAARLYLLDDAGAWDAGAAATAAVRFVDGEQAMCLVVERDDGSAPLRARVQPVGAYELDEATSSLRWSEPAAAGRWHALGFEERRGFAAVTSRIAALAAGAPPAAAPAPTPAQKMRKRLTAQRKARGGGAGGRRARVTPSTPEELELARRGEWDFYPDDGAS